jgi:hypothetical protein
LFLDDAAHHYRRFMEHDEIDLVVNGRKGA